jgi:hypothetical protein
VQIVKVAHVAGGVHWAEQKQSISYLHPKRTRESKCSQLQFAKPTPRMRFAVAVVGQRCDNDNVHSCCTLAFEIFYECNG